MQTPDATGGAPKIAETLAKLGADDKTGLTDAEVQARLKKYGPNALVEKQKNTFAALLAYFWGPIPWMMEAVTAHDFALAKGSALIDLFLLVGFLLGIWMVPRFGRIRMQVIGFAGMAVGMLMLLVAVGLTNSSLHIPLVFAGFILFNLLMNAGPNSTTFTLAPILFPTQLRGTAGGFAAGVAKLGATLGVFLLPILKEKFGVPTVLGIVSVVSVLGLMVILALRRADTE